MSAQLNVLFTQPLICNVRRPSVQCGLRSSACDWCRATHSTVCCNWVLAVVALVRLHPMLCPAEPTLCMCSKGARLGPQLYGTIGTARQLISFDTPGSHFLLFTCQMASALYNRACLCSLRLVPVGTNHRLDGRPASLRTKVITVHHSPLYSLREHPMADARQG